MCFPRRAADPRCSNYVFGLDVDSRSTFFLSDLQTQFTTSIWNSIESRLRSAMVRSPVLGVWVLLFCLFGGFFCLFVYFFAEILTETTQCFCIKPEKKESPTLPVLHFCVICISRRLLFPKISADSRLKSINAPINHKLFAINTITIHYSLVFAFFPACSH